jgi:dynein heavy chain, axonemal
LNFIFFNLDFFIFFKGLNPWPEEALHTVAKMNLENLEFDGMTPEVKEALTQACVFTH